MVLAARFLVDFLDMRCHLQYLPRMYRILDLFHLVHRLFGGRMTPHETNIPRPSITLECNHA